MRFKSQKCGFCAKIANYVMDIALSRRVCKLLVSGGKRLVVLQSPLHLLKKGGGSHPDCEKLELVSIFGIEKIHDGGSGFCGLEEKSKA